MKSRYYDSNEILIGDGSTYPDTITAAALAALLDHGTLTGLSDDDHTQYLLINGTRAMTGNLTMPNAGYVKFGSDFTGWRGSSTSAYVRGYIGVTAKLDLTAAALNPVTNNGLTLGTSSASWADLYLASGGVINWNNGTATITESSGAVAIGSNSATAFNVLNDVGASAYAQIYNAGGTGYWSHIHSSGTLYIGTSGTGGVTFYTDNSGSTVQFAIARTASAVNYLTVAGGISAAAGAYMTAAGETNVAIYYSTKGSGNHEFFTNGATNTKQFVISHTASAVNYWQFTGNITTGRVWAYATGSDTDVGINIATKGVGGIFFYSHVGSATQFAINPTASAVNYLQATGGVTGSPGVAYLSAQGSDSNVSMYLQTKGTGALGVTSGSSISIAYFYPGATNANYFQFFASAAGSSPTIQFSGSDTDVSGVYRTQAAGGHYFYTNSGAQLQFQISHTASAVNYWQFTGAATAQGLTCYATGSDTNIPITFVSKGTGAITLYGNGGSQFVVSPTASAVNYLQVSGGATGNTVSMTATGSDGHIGIKYTTKGTNAYHQFYAEAAAGTYAFFTDNTNATLRIGRENQDTKLWTDSNQGLVLSPGNGSGTGEIIVTKPINFPDTQVASSDANSLDDYEEGTWTPTVGGTSTYSSRTGYYCKIGEQFILWWDFTISSIGTGSTSIVSGCPFTATVGKQGTGSGFWAGWSGTYVYTQPIDNGSATMRPYGATAAASGLSALSPFTNGARWLGQYTTGT